MRSSEFFVNYFCNYVKYNLHLVQNNYQKMKLGNHIRRCRFDHNEMSKKELAHAVGVTRQTIHSIEKGKFVPSSLLALKLAKFFRKSVEELFYVIDED